MAREGTRMNLYRPMALWRGLIRGDLCGFFAEFPLRCEGDQSWARRISSGRLVSFSFFLNWPLISGLLVSGCRSH